MSYQHREPREHNMPSRQPQYGQSGQPPAYGAPSAPPYGLPQPPYGAPAPSGYGTAQRPRNVTTAAVLALVFAALRIIACLFLLVATIRLSLHDTTRAVPNFVDLFVGGVYLPA